MHRDVKPSNILVPTRAGPGGALAKLTDFGVARVMDGEQGHVTLTRTGDVIGTAAYMAPEQAQGRSVTAAVDLYALALVCYEALTGVNPVRNALTGTALSGPRSAHHPRHLPPLRRQRG